MDQKPCTKFGRNSTGRLQDMEKGCARAHVQMHSTSDMCKALIYWVPIHTQNLNAIRPTACEIRNRGVHVRTCRCTPAQTCVKLLSNGSLFTHKIWTRSAQPFARSGKRSVHVRTCRCIPHQTCANQLSNGSLFTHKIWTQFAHPFARSGKRGVRVRTCRRTPPQACVKLLSNGSLFTYKIWAQSAQPFARYERGVCTCARADSPHLYIV